LFQIGGKPGLFEPVNSGQHLASKKQSGMEYTPKAQGT